MTVHPAEPSPDPDAVALASRTLDGLLGPDAVRPAGWTREDCLPKGTGRVLLSDDDRDALGHAAARFPLLS